MLTDTGIALPSLIELIKQRDRQGYNLLYEQFSPLLYGLIYKMVRDVPVAEDLLQDTYIKIWKNIDQFDNSKASFITWLMSIARYTAIDYLRSKTHRQQQKIQQLENIEYDSNIQIVIPGLETAGLRNIVSALEPKYREVIELLYFMGYTQEEAANELALPLGTLKTRARYALQMLRNKM
jgi:RNA polymerase sigma-70 factor (ECF subfamily)